MRAVILFRFLFKTLNNVNLNAECDLRRIRQNGSINNHLEINIKQYIIELL